MDYYSFIILVFLLLLLHISAISLATFTCYGYQFIKSKLEESYLYKIFFEVLCLKVYITHL